MSLFFFDLLDKNGVHRDDVGLEFPHLEAAVANARRALAEMARETEADNGVDRLEILIRDHAIGPVKVTIEVTVEHLSK